MEHSLHTKPRWAAIGFAAILVLVASSADLNAGSLTNSELQQYRLLADALLVSGAYKTSVLLYLRSGLTGDDCAGRICGYLDKKIARSNSHGAAAEVTAGYNEAVGNNITGASRRGVAAGNYGAAAKAAEAKAWVLGLLREGRLTFRPPPPASENQVFAAFLKIASAYPDACRSQGNAHQQICDALSRFHPTQRFSFAPEIASLYASSRECADAQQKADALINSMPATMDYLLNF